VVIRWRLMAGVSADRHRPTDPHLGVERADQELADRDRSRPARRTGRTRRSVFTPTTPVVTNVPFGFAVIDRS
jgi:hypothetical protein